MSLETEEEGGKAARNENEGAQSEVSEIVFHVSCAAGLDGPRRVIVTHATSDTAALAERSPRIYNPLLVVRRV